MLLHKIIRLLVVSSAALAVYLPYATAQDDSRFPITITDATGTQVTIRSIDAIASGSGDITEIIAALGFEDRLVGVDISSTYPEYLLNQIDSIGYGRRLSVEPVAAVNPTVFFCTETCTPTSALEQLRTLDIPVVIIPDNDEAGIELPLQKIRMVAAALGVPEKGAELSEQVEREIDWVRTATANVTEQPYVLMLYFRGTRLQLVAGEGTPSQLIIETAGGIDAAADIGIAGYVPLNPEILLTAYPDYVLLMEGGIEGIGGLEAVRQVQGISQTPAGENNRLLVFDDQYLLGMSTRTGQVMMDIAAILHPSMSWETKVAYPYSITDASGMNHTFEQEVPISATNQAIAQIVGRLGYHPVDEFVADTLILATVDDDWISLRQSGHTVVVIDNTFSIMDIARALGVSGRGTALMARMESQ